MVLGQLRILFIVHAVEIQACLKARAKQSLPCEMSCETCPASSAKLVATLRTLDCLVSPWQLQGHLVQLPRDSRRPPPC